MTGGRALAAGLLVLLLSVAGCGEEPPSVPPAAASPDAARPATASPQAVAEATSPETTGTDAVAQQETPMPTGPSQPTDPRGTALDLLLQEVALFADVVDAADLRQEVEDCDGGTRLGLGVVGGMAGEGTTAGGASGSGVSGGGALEGLVAAYRDRWQAAGWDPQVSEVEGGETTQVSATPGDGSAIDLLVAGDRGGLAVRTACTSADALTPPDLETTLPPAEVHAAQIAAAVLGAEGATGETARTACGPGWQETTVTFRGSVADEASAIDDVRRAMRVPVPLAAHSLLDVDPAGALVVATALDGRLIVRVWAPCQPL